jgi:glucokinase
VTPTAVAIDIGATKLAGALIDSSGALSAHRAVPTRSVGTDGADRVWPDLAALVDELCTAADGPVLGVGVGSAGPLDHPAGTVSPVNIPSWRGFPLVRRLADHTGLPVRLAGDGICAAVGEHWRGAAIGLDDVVVLVVSTGVGGGIIQRGRLHAGRSGNAGHVGHMVVDLDGDDCPCGGRGCVEAIASGPSMVGWALRQGWAGPTARAPGVGPASGADLAAAARVGDPIALAAFERAAQAVAAAIVSVAAVCDLTDAVIGGGVAQAADVLFPPLRTALDRYARLDFLRGIEVREAALGSAAGLYGAAALLLDPDRY